MKRTFLDQTQRALKDKNSSTARAEQRSHSVEVDQVALRDLINTLPALVFVADPAGSNLYVNKQYQSFTGREAQDLLGEGWLDTLHPEDCKSAADIWAEAVAAGEPYEAEYRIRSANGEFHWFLCRATPVRNNGQILRWVGTATDTDDAHRAEENARANEARFQTVFQNAALGMACVSFEGERWIKVNDALCAMLGYTRQELLAQSWTVITHPDDIDLDLMPFRRMAQGEIDCYTVEKRFRHQSGRYLWARLTLSLVRTPDGQPDFEVCMVEDISAQKAAEDVRRAEMARTAFRLQLEERLRAALTAREALTAACEVIGRHFDAALCVFNEVQGNGEQTVVESEWRAGNTASAMGHHRMSDYGAARVAELLAGHVVVVEDVQADPRTAGTGAEGAYAALGARSSLDVPLRRNGQVRMLLSIGAETPRAWSKDEVALAQEVVEHVWDAAERVRAEGALRASERRFRDLADTIREVFYVHELDEGCISYISPAYEQVWGRSVAELYTNPVAFVEAIHPEDRWKLYEAMGRQVRGEATEVEYRLLRDDGSIRYIYDRTFPAPDHTGASRRVVGIAEDITVRHAVEQQLRQANARLIAEIERREAVQATLVHSQKMEAIGQLTSGIAHDFNNAIAAIAGGFAIIERRTQDPRLLDVARHGVKAAERGAALVRHLMAFARQQVLEPRSIDLCSLLTEAEPLLQRSLGPTVALQMDCPEGVGMVRADPAHLETALINLAVNARDAMPEGGSLRIAIRPCPHDEPDRPPELGGADAVVIEVQDTGCGMSPDVLRRAADPFFTTKGVGKGTGLGLAMVHGFAHQSGGTLRLKSREGEGCIVTLFVPSSLEPNEEPAILPLNRVPEPHHRRATILVVDDDQEVAAITSEMLRDLGYRVLEANDAETALAHARSGSPIDAMLSDVLMPDTDGPTLAVALCRLRPDLPVMFMTGHADHKQLVGERVIGKPFTPDQLGQIVIGALQDQLKS